ncbi:hypothetical protein [Mucilaginibacter polytrichastri]|uniref:hypothetical protein n=1 Tax=Mucilaginibacter polytrichastri TaxID=1302689 RepID=UPI0008E740BF|nr:hypothetical protein [Mucilaginibacter polytrichastri]SFS95178.1 hypothetical protein SAMN04487890_10729 [Mucilaginibacter polytrichastri]
MIENIGSNKYQLIGKLIAQIAFILLLILLLYVAIYPRGNKIPIILNVIVIALALIANVLIIVQILLLPIGVSINNLTQQLEIKYLLKRRKVVQNTDIESYSLTNIYTRSSEYNGVLIQLVEREKILLSDFNLKILWSDYYISEKFKDKLHWKREVCFYNILLAIF